MTCDRRALVLSALDFALSSIRQLKSDPAAFLAFCARQAAVPQTALDKLVAETALLALLARRALGAVPQFESLCSEIAPLVRTQVHYSLLCENPKAAAGLRLAHTCLHVLGFEDQRFDDALARCTVSDDPQMPTFRRMEQRWLNSLRTGLGSPQCGDLLPNSVVARARAATEWDDATCYALTHEIFYLTDFGRCPPPMLAGSIETRDAIDAAIAAAIGRNNLDILAELLLSHCLLEGQPSEYAVLGEALLVETWQEYGFLPGPHFNIDELEHVPRELWPIHTVFGVYHTVFVGALYLMAHLQRGWPSYESMWRGRGAETNLAWLPLLRSRDAPVLRSVLAQAPQDVQPVLAAAAAARARQRSGASLAAPRD